MTRKLGRTEFTDLLARWRSENVALGIAYPLSDGGMRQMYFEGIFGASQPRLVFRSSLASVELLTFAISDLTCALRIQMDMTSECGESVPHEHRNTVLAAAEGLWIIGLELKDGIIAITEIESGVTPEDQDGVRYHFMRHMVGERRIPVAVMPGAHC
jgi:hypothetical protein